MGCGASAQPSGPTAEEIAKEKKRLEDEAKAASVAKTGAEASKKAKDKVSERMKDALEKVKENAAGYLEDPEMMTKILDVVLQFQMSTIQDQRSLQVFKYSLLGHSMERSVSKNFSKAVQALTTSQRLAKNPEIDQNMFDFSHLQKKIQAVVTAMDIKKEEGEESDDDDDEDINNPKSAKAKKLTEYEGHRTEMVEFLSLCYDFITALPDKVLSKCFKGVDVDAQREEKTRMAGKVGSAAFAIKVYDFLRMGKDLRRVAFVGPESVGKSTCINHLLADGRNEDFMAVSSGMGTQICCLISSAPAEKLVLMTSQGQEHFGSGKGLAQKMSEQNEKMKKKKKIGDISAFRATKCWNPPFEVELVDVPGIKQETRFESVLALSVCSTICICLGKIDQATSLFKSGQLTILAEICRDLPSVQLLCLITRDVDPKSYDPKAYQALLQEVIPNARGIAVVYANFLAMGSDDAKKMQSVSNFYKAVGRHNVREAEPHRIFTSLAGELDEYLRKCTIGINDCEDDYLTEEFERLKSGVQEKLGKLKLNPETVKKQLKRTPINKQFKMDPKNFPVFCVGIAQHAVSEVADEVLIAQELLFECRIAIISWLRNQGEMLHALAFGDNFDAMCEMAYASDGEPERKKQSRTIVCDAFCSTSDLDTARKANPDDMKFAAWWESKYSHRVGPFLKYESFPWIIIGYYLIRSEQKSKRLLFEHFLMKSDGVIQDWSIEASKVLIEELKLLPDTFGKEPNGWAPRCQAKMSGDTRHEVYMEIFTVIAEACGEFERIVNDKGLAHAGEPLDQLFEVAFVMLQRLLVRKPFEEDLQWTPFAKHLRQAVKSIQSLKQISKSLKEVKEVGDVKGLCQEALDLMRQSGSGKIQKWKKKTTELEDDINAIALMTSQLSTGFVEGKNCLTIIKPRSDADVENEAPESTPLPVAGSFAMTEETTIDGWQIMMGKDYEPCKPDLSKLLTRWKLVDQVDRGYFKTDRQWNSIELSKDQAEEEVAKGNKFVFYVDMNVYTQVNMKSEKVRQLKPTGNTSVSIREKSGALGTGAMGNEIGGSGGEEGLPEECAEANRSVMKRFTTNNPSPGCPDDLTYAKSAIKAVRDGGSRIVIYYRRLDELSTDPVGIDKLVLAELEMEPHVGTCFVVWPSPPSHIDAWKNDASWKKFSGDVKIRLYLAKDLPQLLDDLEKELTDSDDVVDLRIKAKEKKIHEKASKFNSEISEFVKHRSGNEHNTASYFQQHFTEVIRGVADSKAEEVRQQVGSDVSRLEMKYPEFEVLAKMPGFMVGAVDKVDGEGAYTINELKCRAFLSNILLGQTLEHAQGVARQVYDGAFMAVLNTVAEWFCMDGEIFLKELAIYCKGEEADADVKLIADFINRDHFVQMFAGCTLWNVMPMLYSVVLPVLWDREKDVRGGVSDFMYSHNSKRAIEMLQGDMGIGADATAKGIAG